MWMETIALKIVDGQTMKEQSRNRTDNCIVEIEGERKILQDWIDETGSYSRAIKKEGSYTGTQTLITPKGRETFRLLFLKASA
mgnify:CR=1 FL=1